MSRRATALLVVLVFGSAAAAVSPGASRSATITVRNDKVTAVLERTPVATVLAAIVEQTGAKLRGEVLAPREVTLTLDDAPLEDTLERLLGEQSFTLTYDGDGRLKRIALGGKAVTRAPAANAGAPGAAKPAPWPPNEEVAEAVRRVAEFIQSDRTVPVHGRLAEALGTSTATFKQVATAALKHEDERVRAQARRSTVKTLAADPEVRVAVVTTIDSLPDDRLVLALRNAAGTDADRLALAFARHGRSPVLSRRMQRALSQLRAPSGGS